MNDTSASNTMELAASIVSAFVSNNSIVAEQVPDLIAKVHASLQMIQNGGAPVAEKEELKPAVSPKKSVTDDFITCLNCGKKFKSLKRHLRTDHGLTPDEYRVRWGLANDFPMTARNYSATRSVLAKSIGLGQKRKG
jgi:predicted transcriptional regulator